MGVARLYRAGTPYNAVDLRDLDFEQSADVMYFAHLNYPPTKLTRFGHTSWTFSTVTFGPTNAPPTGISATASEPNATDAFNEAKTYAVTAVDDSGGESRLSGTATAVNDLSLKGNLNTVSWTPNGAAFYNVYAQDNGAGAYGYIGRADTASFIDNRGGVSPDYADGPPSGQNPFDGPDNWPSTVTFFEQRLIFGRTRSKPNGVWGSQSSSFENMDISRPTKADDAIVFGLVSGRVNAVNQLVGMKSLLALTSDAIFAIDGGNQGDPLTPSAIVSRRQSGRGSSRLNPIVVDNVAFFKPSQGSAVRTVGYTFQQDGYESNNVSIFSPHFFDGFQIVAWAYQQEPYACIWAARDDGKLLCFTWEQEQQVWGWTLCTTPGFVLDVATITENGYDRLYLLVRRTIGGVTSVFVEIMSLPINDPADLPTACHLDCSIAQQFAAPVSVVTGLSALEGASVSALADGAVVAGLTVQNGTVTLPTPASVVIVGLPYAGLIETMPLAQAGAKRQNMNKAIVRVVNAGGLTAGPRGGPFYPLKAEDVPPPAGLYQRNDCPIELTPSWSDQATIVVRQDQPLPATITAIFAEPAVTK